MFGYEDMQKNEPTYQQHPVTVILTDFFCGSLAGLICYLGSGWLYKRKEKKLQKARSDKFYDEVARELQEKPMVPGLWTKAFAEMGGDDAKARALYIKYRVVQLCNEAALANEKQKSESKRRAKEQRLAIEAAKPPLSWYEKLANVLLGCFCGCLALLFVGVTIACLSDEDRANSGMSFVDTVMLVVFMGAIAFAFGFITYKCFKAVAR